MRGVGTVRYCSRKIPNLPMFLNISHKLTRIHANIFHTVPLDGPQIVLMGLIPAKELVANMTGVVAIHHDDEFRKLVRCVTPYGCCKICLDTRLDRENIDVKRIMFCSFRGCKIKLPGVCSERVWGGVPNGYIHIYIIYSICIDCSRGVFMSSLL